MDEDIPSPVSSLVRSSSSSNGSFVEINVDVESPPQPNIPSPSPSQPNIPSPSQPNLPSPSPSQQNISSLRDFLTTFISVNPPPPDNVSEPSEVSDTDDIGFELPIDTFDPMSLETSNSSALTSSNPTIDPMSSSYPTEINPTDLNPSTDTMSSSTPAEINPTDLNPSTDPMSSSTPAEINPTDLNPSIDPMSSLDPPEINPINLSPSSDPDSSTPAEISTLIDPMSNPTDPIPSQSPPPPLVEPNQSINMPMILRVLLAVSLVTTLAIITCFFRSKPNYGCEKHYVVANDGKGDFRTISAALEATPNQNPYKFCIILRKGEYHEIVNIGLEKTNIVLRGEGIEKTTIISNAIFQGDLTVATLSVNGQGFYGREFMVVNTANDGVAVSNSADHSAFYKCRMKGVLGSSLHVQRGKQFYRSCQLYGRNDLVSGSADSYFQKCELYKERMDHQGHTAFIIDDVQLALSKTNLIFHMSSFYGVGNSINSLPAVFLVNALGEYCSIVVMQSYLDASISGYIGSKKIPDTTYIAIFDNHGPGATKKVVPEFVHVLVDVRDASRFSLRSEIVDRDLRIPSDMDYDLDLDS